MRHVTVILAIASCLISLEIKGQEVTPKKEFKIHVAGGIRHAAERDQAFSPLVYAGWTPSVLAGFEINQLKKSELFLINYSKGNLNNFYDNTSGTSILNLFNYTLYNKWDALNGKFIFGWSNNNSLSMVDFHNALNFNPRLSYLTSFGAAFQFQHKFSGFLTGFSVEVVGHLQLLGFKIQSSYVSAAPSGYEDNYDSGILAALNSMKLFYPVDNWHWGIWPMLGYKFNSGNSINFRYRYDMLILKGAHSFSNSSGTYLISLTTQL